MKGLSDRNRQTRRTLLSVTLVMGCIGLASGQEAQPGTKPQPITSTTSVIDQNRTEKQRLLDDAAQRLVLLAAELKVEVDKTNKNILSLDVIRKAEEIETLAHKLRDQARR